MDPGWDGGTGDSGRGSRNLRQRTHRVTGRLRIFDIVSNNVWNHRCKYKFNWLGKLCNSRTDTQNIAQVKTKQSMFSSIIVVICVFLCLFVLPLWSRVEWGWSAGTCVHLHTPAAHSRQSPAQLKWLAHLSTPCRLVVGLVVVKCWVLCVCVEGLVCLVKQFMDNPPYLLSLV